MTQKDIDKFLANTKVYLNGKSNKEIQEKLFSLGYCWPEWNSKEIKNINAQFFMYIHKNNTITWGCNMCDFTQDEYREISAEEILSIERTEPAYRPFKDKEECFKEIQKHQPFMWVLEENEAFTPINKINNIGVRINNYTYFYKESFEKLKFADGTPFGIKEN